jgi:hypothetical protein
MMVKVDAKIKVFADADIQQYLLHFIRLLIKKIRKTFEWRVSLAVPDFGNDKI